MSSYQVRSPDMSYTFVSRSSKLNSLVAVARAIPWLPIPNIDYELLTMRSGMHMHMQAQFGSTGVKTFGGGRSSTW